MLSEAAYKTNDALTDLILKTNNEKTEHCIFFLIVAKHHVGFSKPQQQPQHTYHISIMLIGLYQDHTVAERQKQKS